MEDGNATGKVLALHRKTFPPPRGREIEPGDSARTKRVLKQKCNKTSAARALGFVCNYASACHHINPSRSKESLFPYAHETFHFLRRCIVEVLLTLIFFFFLCKTMCRTVETCFETVSPFSCTCKAIPYREKFV